jgi:hypothetical protein
VLIQRRDKIGAAYLVAVTPLVDFELSTDGRLSFDNAAVTAGVATAPPGGYRVKWARFDNATGALAPLGEGTIAPGERPSAPASLPADDGSFVCVEVSAVAPQHGTWAPVKAYFKRAADAWTLVGLVRSGA